MYLNLYVILYATLGQALCKSVMAGTTSNEAIYLNIKVFVSCDQGIDYNDRGTGNGVRDIQSPFAI